MLYNEAQFIVKSKDLGLNLISEENWIDCYRMRSATRLFTTYWNISVMKSESEKGL